MQELNEEQRQAFKQVKVLTKKDDYFGIPSKIFYNIVAFSIGLGAILHSPLVGLVFLAVLGIPAYHIHRNDPFALQVWIRAVSRRYGRWCAGRGERRKLYIIKRGK
jgi:hypothetical protein